MSDLLTREATLEDVNDIAGVHRLSRAWYYGTEPDERDRRESMWAHLLAEPGRIAWVAERHRTVIGFLAARRVKEPVPALELTGLYVLPDRARSGVGSRLHELFENERHNGELGILEVWSANSRAIAFYEHRGWLSTEVKRPGPDGGDFVTYQPAGAVLLGATTAR